MKSKIGWLLMVLFKGVTGADLYFTWLNTPDLKMEANPLVSVLGYGWPALIIANVATIIIYCFLTYYAFTLYPRRKQQARVGEGRSGSSSLGMIGYSLSLSLLISRIFPVLEWWSITRGKPQVWLLQLVNKLPSQRQDLILSCILVLVFGVQWMITEHLEEKRYAQAVD